MVTINCSVRTRAYAGIPERAELNGREHCNTITSVAKDNLIIEIYATSNI